MDWKYVNRRLEYDFDDRGFPEVDVGDNVTINTLYTDYFEADVLSTSLSYNGTISGKTKLLGK